MVNKDWLDIEVLEDYLDGKLDAKTMNRVEREALEDPFVAEALAGLSRSPKRSLQSLSILQKQLQERIGQHQRTKKVSVVTWQRLSIAAAAAVLFIAVSIVFWMKENNNQKQLALANSKKVDVTLAPKEFKNQESIVKGDSSIKQAQSMVDVSNGKSEKAKVPKSRVSAEMERAFAAAKANDYIAMNRDKYASALSNRLMKEERTDSLKAKSLNEVVVVGYGVQQRKDITGSVSTIVDTPKKMEVNNALLGKVAGIQIRGLSSRSNGLVGRVIDQVDGKPLPGVFVKVEGTNLNATTNANGEFIVRSDTAFKAGKISTSYIGYKSVKVNVKDNQSVNIALEQDHESLNEVVVVGYGGRKRDKRADYILKHNKFAEEPKLNQVVELTFDVDKKGRPENIKVTKSLGQQYDAEAIRLIKGGPKWAPPKLPGEKTIFKIAF